MSTKVDVLAVVESAVDALSETVATRGIAYKLGAAHAAIAKLIAADLEYDEARYEFTVCHANDPKRHERSVRLSAAIHCRAEALAAVGGEGQG